MVKMFALFLIYAIDHLDRFYIVPGFGTKVSRIFLQMIPGSLSAKIMYKLQSQRKRVGE